MTERYYVMRASTRQILDRDADLTPNDDMMWALTAVGSASFTCPPNQATGKASDGRPVIGDYDSIVIVEENEQIRWAGLVTKSEYSGPDWVVQCDSIATGPVGIPFMGRYYAAETDPADIMRVIWAHVQSFPDADMNVEVIGDTPLKVGTYSTQTKADTAAAYADTQKAYNAENAKLKSLRADRTAASKEYTRLVAARVAASAAVTAAGKIRPKNPQKVAAAKADLKAAQDAQDAQDRVVDQKAAAVNAQEDVVAARSKERAAALAKKTAASKAEKDDGGAYALEWWQAPDCGQALAQLATDNGFDWFERYRWTDAKKSDFVTSIVIAYPRAGRERRDLTFEQGVNIDNVVTATSGDGYMNEAFGIGSGEGAGAIRRSRATRDGRLRRVGVVNAKDVKSNATMDKRLQKELTAHRQTLTFGSIDISSMKGQAISAVGLGDDITVVADVEHLGRQKIMHRVTGITKTGDNTATLTLRRSDSFIYGG